MKSNFHIGWYLIYTMPKHERKIVLKLRESGIETIFPTMKSVSKWHDRKKIIDKPFFPSYVFVFLKDLKGFHDVISTNGVLYFVRTGSEVAKVSDKVINNIRLLSDNRGELEVSSGIFNAGDRVLIKDGPLTGLDCEIVNHSGKQVYLVRVNLLQRCILISVKSERLTEVENAYSI